MENLNRLANIDKLVKVIRDLTLKGTGTDGITAEIELNFIK